jgi:hypothetical protein
LSRVHVRSFSVSLGGCRDARQRHVHDESRSDTALDAVGLHRAMSRRLERIPEGRIAILTTFPVASSPGAAGWTIAAVLTLLLILPLLFYLLGLILSSDEAAFDRAVGNEVRYVELKARADAYAYGSDIYGVLESSPEAARTSTDAAAVEERGSDTNDRAAAKTAHRSNREPRTEERRC